MKIFVVEEWDTQDMESSYISFYKIFKEQTDAENYALNCSKDATKIFYTYPYGQDMIRFWVINSVEI